MLASQDLHKRCSFSNGYNRNVRIIRAVACGQRCKITPCRALQQHTAAESPKLPEHPQWVHTLVSTAVTAALCLGSISGSMTEPAWSNEGPAEMDHSAMGHMQAPPETAAARFSCTPLTPQERIAFLDLGGFSHKIHTSSAEAQTLFDQGLLLAYDFNRPEAVNSFETGLQFDRDAPMLYWGLSHSRGPFINKVWGPAPADGSFIAFTPEEQNQALKDAQAGLAVVRHALASSPSDPELQYELSLLEAEAELWGSVPRDVGYDDPRALKALEQYAQKMEAIAAAHPGDPDTLALAADARMSISPWIHWQGPLGKRTAVKADVVVKPAMDDIAEALRRSPGHPLASHLMIHLTEAGTPGPGLPAVPGNAAMGESAADSLAFNHPYTSMGHLMHMPGHNFIRVGRWHDAVTTNQAALRADEAGIKRCVQPYMPEHQAQMLLYSASNSGELKLAEEYAEDSVAYPGTFGIMHMSDGKKHTRKYEITCACLNGSASLLLRTFACCMRRCLEPYEPEHNSQMLLYAAANSGELALAEQYADASVNFPATYGPMNMADGRERVAKALVQARFGKWDPLLQLPLSDLDYSSDGLMMIPPTANLFGEGVYHYVRALALAYAAAHDTGESAKQLEQQMRHEVELLAQVAERTPDDTITRPGEGIGVYSPGYKHLTDIELLMGRARGDVLVGDLRSAASKLRTAVKVDQDMGYMEPPRQFQPVRECLGWVLLQQGDLDQAEKEYLADLAELPENPWALKGLTQVYAAQGPKAAGKLKEAESRLSAAWSHADPGLAINSSCPAFSD